jgi:hypothetical protein
MLELETAEIEGVRKWLDCMIADVERQRRAHLGREHREYRAILNYLLDAREELRSVLGVGVTVDGRAVNLTIDGVDLEIDRRLLIGHGLLTDAGAR